MLLSVTSVRETSQPWSSQLGLMEKSLLSFLLRSSTANITRVSTARIIENHELGPTEIIESTLVFTQDFNNKILNSCKGSI